MKQFLFTFCHIVFMGFTSCSQVANPTAKTQKHIGGPCEGCEAIYENPTPFEKLSNVDTLPDFHEPGPKLEISGIVYKADGRTPAKDVVLYVYHTDQKGVYPKRGDEKGWAQRHGYIRGWMKTNANGQYKFYTLRPAAYPGRQDPQHIHITVKEPDKNEYWIDEYVFADDPLLQRQPKSDRKPRGGSGVLTLQKAKDDMHSGTRNIILGLNVEDYPTHSMKKNAESGLAVGSDCPPFDPVHFSGADTGKRACPTCKYGYGKGVMVWFNHANFDSMRAFVQTMEKEVQRRGEKALRVFPVYMNPMHEEVGGEEQKILQQKIKDWRRQQNLHKVAAKWVNTDYGEGSVQTVLQYL